MIGSDGNEEYSLNVTQVDMYIRQRAEHNLRSILD
jgi:hypothetical protein